MNNLIEKIKTAATKKERVELLKTLIKKRDEPRHPVDVEADTLMDRIGKWRSRYGSFDLNPEFQRGHVWTTLDQQKYIEALLRGTLPRQAKTITLNICGWHGVEPTGDLPKGGLCIDGLQRITALEAFKNKQITVFGGLDVDDLADTSFAIEEQLIHIAIYDYQQYKDVLDLYIDMNDSGVAHTQEEIERVKLIRQKVAE
ncbi:DUF262 domain-containing protein [Acinetobacter indicus]|uniref:DUF262 domain-containing protein n=1 Tax=Acinetobacter TaxID=469 RepID=UPI0015D2A07C|nr:MULTISPECIES: DUF262 domain-containing protein [Acinetobacter]MCP0917882.1 DUF262 domain-containing protein [Acinetobacter indicus]